jgi:hypothetical protein
MRLGFAFASGGRDDERRCQREPLHDAGRASGSATRNVVPSPRFDS